MRGRVRMPSGARRFGAVDSVSTSGCVTTPTTLPERSMKVRMRESSREPRRADLASAFGVDCLLSRLICRLSNAIESDHLQEGCDGNLTKHLRLNVLGEAWECRVFCTSGWVASWAGNSSDSAGRITIR